MNTQRQARARIDLSSPAHIARVTVGPRLTYVSVTRADTRDSLGGVLRPGASLVDLLDSWGYALGEVEGVCEVTGDELVEVWPRPGYGLPALELDQAFDLSVYDS